MRGMGRVYLRGTIWWIQYSHRGQRHMETSGSDKVGDARRLLKQRIGEMGRGKTTGPARGATNLCRDGDRDHRGL